MARATALKDSAPPRPWHERHRPEQTLLYRIIDRHYPEFLACMVEPRILSWTGCSAFAGVQSKAQRRGIVVLFHGVATQLYAAASVHFAL